MRPFVCPSVLFFFPLTWMVLRRRKRPGKKKEKKNPGINPGQPAGKGRKKKKNLVLTLGSPQKKGGIKKEEKKPWY